VFSDVPESAVQQPVDVKADPVEGKADPLFEHGVPFPITDEDGLAAIGDGDGLVPIAGENALVPAADGDGLNVETVGAGLSPLLPISTEPNGIPTREMPPGDDDVTAEDEALPLAVLHGPDIAVLPGNAVPVPTPIPPPS
jgi:hypothetical protein